MTREEELHLIVDLMHKHGLPISPVLEYAIQEKLGSDGNLLSHINEQEASTNASWAHKIPQDKVFAYTQLIASVRKQYKSEEPQSLSHALKQLRNPQYWNSGIGDALAQVGITSPNRLTPRPFLELIKNNVVVNEKGQNEIGLWGLRRIKDSTGAYVVNDDGSYAQETVFRACRTFTPEKLIKLLIQNDILKSD